MALFALSDPADLPLPASLEAAVQHGEVFTRRWVVEAVLDLVGYTAQRDLALMRIVEPACGGGAFLWSSPVDLDSLILGRMGPGGSSPG